MTESTHELAEITFDQLPDALRSAAERAGWSSLMPVQARSIPYLLDGRDIRVQARTGSGKTGAFVLPMLQLLDPAEKSCQALVLVPTRELARQVADAAKVLGGKHEFKVVAVYGGVKYKQQLDAFREGVQLVVGTPGRVLDHLIRGTLNLESLRMLIFDEADRMLSMGFFPDMVRVKSFLPKRRVHSSMFSATYPFHVQRLAAQFLHEPETLSLSTDHVHVTDVEHVYYEVPAMRKDRCLLRIIEIENPPAAIIFCNRRQTVNYVTAVLQNFGYDAGALSSDLSQGAREKTLNRVRDGRLRFLVATDVAARGIDIPEISHVFQYEPPEDPESYIHRAGRTGRAGASGEAITLVAGPELVEMRRIAKQYKIDMDERETPTDEEVAEVVTQRATAFLEARLRELDSLHRERLQRFLPLVRSLSEDDEQAQLIAMLVDAYYQERQHAPALPPQKEKREAGEAGETGDKPKRKRRRRRKKKD
ncbi:MAG: DEAD/DEAH box helicase [Planctomycetota bacterium]|jgi:ATP-dependent RNA helicase DeaD